MELDISKAFQFLADKTGNPDYLETMFRAKEINYNYFDRGRSWIRYEAFTSDASEKEITIRLEYGDRYYRPKMPLPWFEDEYFDRIEIRANTFADGFDVSANVIINTRWLPLKHRKKLIFGPGRMGEVELDADDLPEMFPHQGATELDRVMINQWPHAGEWNEYDSKWDLTGFVENLDVVDIKCNSFIWEF
jgi:hypothetical protein